MKLHQCVGLGLISFMVAFMAWCFFCPGPDTAAVLQDTVDSTIFIEVCWHDKRVRCGSGFVVGEDLVMTARHVLGEKETIYTRVAEIPRKELRYRLYYPGGDYAVCDPNSMSISDKWDIGTLEVETFGHEPLTLSPVPEIGTPVYSVGHPFCISTARVATGIVSTQVCDASVFRSNNLWNNEMFLTDADIDPGNSGGVLIDAWGNVVGVTVGAWGTLVACIPGECCLEFLENGNGY